MAGSATNGLLYHTPFPRLRGRLKQNCLLDMTGPHRTRAESSGGYVHSTCTKSVNQHSSTKCKGVNEPLLLTEELRTADGFKGRESQFSLRMWLLVGQWTIPCPGVGKNNQNVLYKILKQIIRYILKRKFLTVLSKENSFQLQCSCANGHHHLSSG